MKGKKGNTNLLLLIGAIVLVAILALFSTKLLGQKEQSSQTDSSKAVRIEELASKLNNNPSYRDKSSQAYKDARQELCSLTARPAEEREKAVANIRDFLGRSSVEVEFNCSGFEGRDFSKVKEEIYTTPMGYFVIDPKTNYVLTMEPEPGRWGTYVDGTRWSTPEQQYDYSSRYTMAQVENVARKFIADHKKSLGDINLEGMALGTGQKDGGGDKVNYFFTWTGKDKTAYQETQCGDVDKSLPGVFYDDKGNPCIKATLYHTPSLSMTVTSGGQVIVYSNELATH